MAVSEGLKKAVEEKDIVAVRSLFYTIILSDPMFRTSKFDETLEYVKQQKIEGLMDDYDGEELKPEEEWTEEYFDILASKLQDNFSEERIAQIKKVAKAVGMSECSPPEAKKIEKVENKIEILPSKEKGKGARNGTESNEGSKRLLGTYDGKYDWLIGLGIVLIVVSLIRRLFKGGK